MELCRKYRPQNFNDVVGHSAVKKVLAKWRADDQIPRTIIFIGPSGTGKTTIARILASELHCKGADLQEINCADVRGIDSVRDIQQVIHIHPQFSVCRVWILDEVVQLPKATQQAFLKVLEEPPANVYFFLCTTATEGLLPTFLSRCQKIDLEEISTKELTILLERTVLRENIRIAKSEVIHTIAKTANGSARQALQLLELVMACQTPEDQMAMLVNSEDNEKGKSLVTMLMNKSKSSWDEVSRALTKIPKEDVERVRQGVLAYAEVLLFVPSLRKQAFANMVIQIFRDNFFPCGRPGLSAACWQVCQKNL